MVYVVVYWSLYAMKLYRATSLNDIAKQFRAKAKEATDSMNRTLGRGRRDQLGGEAIAWNAAADMLENMELVEN